jgi:hypothetical protein
MEVHEWGCIVARFCPKRNGRRNEFLLPLLNSLAAGYFFFELFFAFLAPFLAGFFAAIFFAGFLELFLAMNNPPFHTAVAGRGNF